MPVLIEYINVIVPRTVLEEKYSGGFRAYRLRCPNQTFCSDDYLTRIGFMGSHGVEWWIDKLYESGLCHIRDGRCANIAVVDGLFGPCSPCDWLTVGEDSDKGRFVAHIEDDSPVISKPSHFDEPDESDEKNVIV